MILKIWNEITDTWVFVDNVKSVTCNKDYCLRMEDNNIFKVETALLVYKPEKTGIEEKNADILKGMWIPIYDASEEVKNCPDFYLSRNVNSHHGVDYTFVLPNTKYQDKFDLNHIAKIVIVNAYNKEDGVITYLLPSGSDVFLLNDKGQTVDRI